VLDQSFFEIKIVEAQFLLYNRSKDEAETIQFFRDSFINLVLDASSLEVKVSRNSIHEPDEAPERVHLVLHDVQDRSKKVRHPLEELKKKLSMPTNQQMKLFLVYVLTFKFIFKLWNLN